MLRQGQLNWPLCFLLGSYCLRSAAAQTTSGEFRPEFGVYIQQDPSLRYELVDIFTRTQSPENWGANFSFYIDTALKPMLRRELRSRPDVFRNKYLTIRAGYRNQRSLTDPHSAPENRAILELTSRYLLPWQIVVSDRNRGEFQFIQKEPFSTRYRNRIRVERDVRHDWVDATPYVSAEFYYDTRYDSWTTSRYIVGAEFPAGRHVVIVPYCFRQNSTTSSPHHINGFGSKLNLYFGE